MRFEFDGRRVAARMRTSIMEFYSRFATSVSRLVTSPLSACSCVSGAARGNISILVERASQFESDSLSEYQFAALLNLEHAIALNAIEIVIEIGIGIEVY